MSLDISKLEHVWTNGAKTIARCPACASAGHDQKGEHLVINADGSFGCVVYPGKSAEAKQHRKRIFALSGDLEIKPLIVRSPVLGRLGRVNQSQSAGQPLKTGLLGRLGRVFQTHLETEQLCDQKEDRAIEKLDECHRSVLDVLNMSALEAHKWHYYSTFSIRRLSKLLDRAASDSAEHRAIQGELRRREIKRAPHTETRLVNQSQSASEPLKPGLLGRLGRLFETHLEGDQQSKGDKKHPADHQLNECEKGVLAVLGHPKAVLHRPLTDEYILQDRDGDYVEKVESGTTETVKMHFSFTKDIAKAKRFSYDDLWSRRATTSIGGEFTHGFGGGRAIKMPPFQAASRGVALPRREQESLDPPRTLFADGIRHGSYQGRQRWCPPSAKANP